MNAKQLLGGSVKVLKDVDIKKFGRQCIAIGRSIQRKADYKKYKTIVDPIIREGFKSNNKEARSIAGKLLVGFKEFK